MKLKPITWLAGGLVLAALVGLEIWFYGLLRAGAGPKEKPFRSLPPVVGSPAPDFELTGLDGATQTLSSLKGAPVMVNFWATWCSPCKQEIPLLEKTRKKHAGKLVILGIDYEEEPGVVRPFVEAMGMTYPVLLDQTGRVADQFFVKNFPYTFFIDREGVVRAQHLGILSEDQLVKYLETVGIEP